MAAPPISELPDWDTADSNSTAPASQLVLNGLSSVIQQLVNVNLNYQFQKIGLWLRHFGASGVIPALRPVMQSKFTIQLSDEIVNSVAEELFGDGAAGDVKHTIPPNTLALGSIINFRATLRVILQTVAMNVTLSVRMDDTTLAVGTANALLIVVPVIVAANTADRIFIEGSLIVDDVSGGPTAFGIRGQARSGTWESNLPVNNDWVLCGSFLYNTTNAIEIGPTGLMSVADADNKIAMERFEIEVLDPSS